MSLNDRRKKDVIQKYLDHGLSTFTDAEALSLLLDFIYVEENTVDKAYKFLDEFVSFSALVSANPKEIMRRLEVELGAAVLISMVSGLSEKYVADRYNFDKEEQVLQTSTKFSKSLVQHFLNAKNEIFCAIFLDSVKRLIKVERIQEGTIDKVNVYTRDLVTRAFNHGAVNIVVAHNHPSSVLKPSQEDIIMTKSIIEEFEDRGFLLLDHLIMWGEDFYSFKDSGLLDDIFLRRRYSYDNFMDGILKYLK